MSISRNAGYNLIGSLAPIAIGLVTVPLYLELVGADRYGVLAIAFLLLGYFGLFDLGLGRATTYRISALKDAEPIARATVFRTSISVNLAMGAVGAVILYFAAGWFFASVFKVDPALRPEMIASVPFLALTVPMATLMGTMTGTLQACDRFLLANKISILSTFLFQVLPLIVAWLIGPSLSLLLAAALAARLITIFVLWRSCERLLTRDCRPRFDRGEARTLLGYGGWVTLTAMFGPVLVILDRFIIGAVLGATAVTIYTVPFQLAQRFGLFPSALVSALFPRLPTAAPEERAELTEKATRVLLSALTPPIFAAILLITPFFHLWIGSRIGSQSAAVGVPILLGFWINAFAIIPYILLQAIGRPDKVTKLLLLEIPPYLLLLWLGLREFGLIGSACVFALRSAADFALMSWAARGRIVDAGLLAVLAGLLLLAAATTYTFSFFEPLYWASGAALAAPLGWVCWKTLPVDVRDRLVDLVRVRIRRHQS